MDSLETIKSRFKEIAAQGIDLAFPALKTALNPGTDTYNDLMLLEGRYQEVMRQLLQGIISHENSAIEVNKIRKDLLNFIDLLQENHLVSAGGAGVDGKPDVYNGEVLYRIPKQMQLGEETKCIIRLAFDRSIITQDLETQEDDVLKDLRISDVMGVELLDPSRNAFEIRTNHDIVQFLDKDLYTEWLYFVKPLAGGTQNLILKISIIEIRNGIERKRNVVLEEKVEILTTEPNLDASAVFASSGVNMTLNNTPMVMPAPMPEAEAEPDPSPPPPSPLPGAGMQVKELTQIPRPTPESANIPKQDVTFSNEKKGTFRKVASAMSLLAVLVIASVVVMNNVDTKDSRDNPNGGQTAFKIEDASKSELEAFVQENPKSDQIKIAMYRLDSIEKKVWNEAISANDLAKIREYTIEYPNGKFTDEATKKLRNINENLELNAGETEGLTKPTNERVIIRTIAVHPPLFQGCRRSNAKAEQTCTNEAIQQFIKNNLAYPLEAKRKGIQGTVKVDFTIEKDGKIGAVQFQNDIGGGCAKEAIRLVRALPQFEPALDKAGKPMKVSYTLPVKFAL